VLVADTGDNGAQRDFCTIYLLPEPPIPAPGQIIETKPDRKIVFRYEDGPRDCEAVAADPAGGKILLISKRTNPPVLYELPLLPENSGGPLIAKRTGTVRVNRPQSSPMVPYGNQPTGLTISPDGSLAAVLTYYGVFLFPREKGESWAAAFSKTPKMLPPHHLKQAEAITFSRDGKTLYVLSEGTNPPIITYHAE
jgi:DNA-binding beta-propeller fold protein YncE